MFESLSKAFIVYFVRINPIGDALIHLAKLSLKNVIIRLSAIGLINL